LSLYITNEDKKTGLSVGDDTQKWVVEGNRMAHHSPSTKQREGNFLYIFFNHFAKIYDGFKILQF
jgi:hypothetical protein